MSNKKDFLKDIQKRRPKPIDNRKKIVLYIFNIAAIAASAIGLSIAVTSFFRLEIPRTRYSQTEMLKDKLDSELTILKNNIKMLDANRSILSNQISDLKQLPKDAKLYLQISELRSEVKILKNELEILNGAILDNPERAVSVPLLRKDMDNLKDSYKNDLGGLRGEISRVFEQNKWFIGLMFTITLGILGIAVNNFFQNRRISNKS